MKQVYHPNAVTNVHIRRQIKESSLTNFQLTQTFHTPPVTISKWKNRETCEDMSSRPHKGVYALNELGESLSVSIRKTTWLPLDEVWEMLFVNNPQITRSSIYRTFCRNHVNQVPQAQREKGKKFKEYEPGYLHMDVTYLPAFEGKKSYLFVAIDRATRSLFYRIYEAKTSENTEDFMLGIFSF